MTVPAPPILRTAVVQRSLADAFTIFTEEIGAWWPLPTHSLFGERAGGVQFVDDRLVERSIDGDETIWAEVLHWEPPHRLVLAWHPGSDGEVAGRVEVRFSDDGGATRIDLRHDGWEAFGDAAAEQRRSYAGPSAWGHVLDHFANGAEPRADQADVSELEEAYATFFAAADAATVGAASGDDGWTAEQVVAHVALNDLAMTAVAHALVHRDEPVFENRASQDRTNLASVIAAAGDLADLVAFGRRCATQAIAAVRILDEEQRATPVHCRLEDDGEVRLDAPMPWASIAIEIQATRHLPSHTEQLQALRS